MLVKLTFMWSFSASKLMTNKSLSFPPGLVPIAWERTPTSHWDPYLFYLKLLCLAIVWCRQGYFQVIWLAYWSAHVAFLWYQVMCCQERLGKGCIILVYSKNGQEAQHGGMTAFLSSFPWLQWCSSLLHHFVTLVRASAHVAITDTSKLIQSVLCKGEVY